MSAPTGILRYAGDWNVSTEYSYGMFVVASDSQSYGLGVPTNTGTDPTIQPSAVWFLLPSPGGSGGSSITAGGATVACDDPAATGSITLTTTTTGSLGDVTINTVSGASGTVELLTRGTVTIDTSADGGAGLDIKTNLTSSTFESQNTGGTSGSIIFNSADPTNPAKVTIGGAVEPTGLYVSNSQLLFNNVDVIRPNVLSKFGTTSGALALTAAYQNMATQTYTTSVSSAPLTVWGTLNVLDAGGGGASVVSARLVINGTAGIVQQITLDNNHSEQIVCLGGGTGPVGGGLFNVAIQALVTGGAASRITASVITIGQTTLSP